MGSTEGAMSRRHTNGHRQSFQHTAAYESDSSSSDDSMSSVIPSGRRYNSFTSYNPPIKKEASSSATFRRSRTNSDSDLEIVTSDITKPHPQSMPQMNPEATGTIAVSKATPESARYNNAGGKKTMSAAGRERLSRILKERWAAGGMDGVQAKIKETLKRKASLQGMNPNGYSPSKRSASTTDHAVIASTPSALRPLPDSYTSGYSPAQLELWEYIRPHLKEFKNEPLPSTCRIPDLLDLPRQRDVKFNSRRSVKRAYVDTDAKKIAALLLQLTGQTASQPCARCTKGHGVFEGCVKLPANALNGLAKHCANCWYSHQACTYEAGAKETSELDNTIEVEDDLTREVDSEVDSEEEGGLSRTARHRPRRFNGLEAKPPPIIHALSGRPYNSWPDRSGNLATLAGSVLLPDDYHVDSDSGRPYHCPVDSCKREPFAELKGLGYHFPRTHFGKLLNDNCDGTFSVVGTYDERKLGNGGSYPPGDPSFPYVVSQNPKAPWKASPRRRRPSAVAAVAQDPYEVSIDKLDGGGIVQQSTPKDEIPEAFRTMWEYVKPYLTKTTGIPHKGWVKELLPLPRVRDLEWNPYRRSDYYETHPRDISCLIIQVTGEEAPQACTKCTQGKGPFASCVVISKDAPREVRARMKSCANCNYHNQQNGCDIMDWVVKRPQSWTNNPPRSRTVRAPSFDPNLSDSDTRGPIPTITRARQAEESRSRDSTAVGRTSEPAASRDLVQIPRPQPPSPIDRVHTALPGPAQPVPEDMLEMQEWELAPGRIFDESSESRDTVALSRAYLTSTKTRFHNDLEVHNEVITAGKKLLFAPLTNQLRSCFVGSGRLKVKVGEQAEFLVGHGSSFAIPAGVSAWAQNRLYTEALLHINTMTVYD